MLDPGADITLVKHKEFLYDLKSTSITDIQIQSCSHDHIPCKFKGTLLLKINTKGTIAIPAFYTPSIDHSLISTNDFRCNGLYMNERSNALEDTDGNQQLSFITIHNHGWIPATSFQTPTLFQRLSSMPSRPKFHQTSFINYLAALTFKISDDLY